MVEILQNFVAFSEYMNFTKLFCDFFHYQLPSNQYEMTQKICHFFVIFISIFSPSMRIMEKNDKKAGFSTGSFVRIAILQRISSISSTGHCLCESIVR